MGLATSKLLMFLGVASLPTFVFSHPPTLLYEEFFLGVPGSHRVVFQYCSGPERSILWKMTKGAHNLLSSRRQVQGILQYEIRGFTCKENQAFKAEDLARPSSCECSCFAGRQECSCLLYMFCFALHVVATLHVVLCFTCWLVWLSQQNVCILVRLGVSPYFQRILRAHLLSAFSWADHFSP